MKQITFDQLSELEKQCINGNRKHVLAELDRMPKATAIYAAAWLGHALHSASQLGRDPSIISAFLRQLGDRLTGKEFK